jgi:hypothetical protein
MVYTCCTPLEQKQRMFSEAKAMGSSYIRLDIEIGPIFEYWGACRSQPDWKGLDQVIGLSRRYGLPVVGVLRLTPGPVSSCPNAVDPGKCAPTDYGLYGHLVARIASHSRGVIRHWEVLNEPDGSWAFDGSAEQYAWMLRRSYAAIKAVAPEDSVLLGGVMGLAGRGWLRRVFATPGADARHRYDIANVHLRSTMGALGPAMRRFRDFFAGAGFRGPLWVTEHGYPGDERFQRDARYRDGERGQARYLRRSLPALVRAGARQVFVTLRDSTAAEFGDSEFASEGVLNYPAEAPGAIRRKPAFAAIRWLADVWPVVPATKRDLDRAKRTARRKLR